VPHAGSRIVVGMAAIGVTLGGISAVMAGIFGKFIDQGRWIPMALIGTAIAEPSMLIAWLKLRQRGLGPILDWCLARIIVQRFGASHGLQRRQSRFRVLLRRREDVYLR
jgi:hypothetical protein